MCQLQHRVILIHTAQCTFGLLRPTPYPRSRALRRCQANERFLYQGGLLFERLPRKREFQTDLTQAFIVLHDRELDFFSSDTLRLTFASQKLVFTETSF